MDEKALYEMVCVKRRCPECNGETHQTEKETFTGREMREYQCKACGWRHIFELGPALWTVFSNANNDVPRSPDVAREPAPSLPRASAAPAGLCADRLRLTVLRCWRRLCGRQD
jgi:rubredoxin